MRLFGAMLVLAGFVGPVLGTECALVDARYTQAGSDWTVQFHPVPIDAAVNQSAAFTLTMPKSSTTMEGGVWQPNGYSSSRGAISGACDPKGQAKKTQEQCSFWEAVIYVGTVDGMAVLSMDDDTPAPAQILLPELGAALWYSSYRQEFLDAEPGDVFDLAGCAPGPG